MKKSETENCPIIRWLERKIERLEKLEKKLKKS